MNLAMALTAATEIAKLLRMAADTGKDAAPMIGQLYDILVKGRNVTAEELDKLIAERKARSAEGNDNG